MRKNATKYVCPQRWVLKIQQIRVFVRLSAQKSNKIRVSGSAENHSRLSSYTELFLGPEDGFSCHFTRSRHLGLDEVHLLRSDSVGRDSVIPS